jgi:hypothetical protein
MAKSFAWSYSALSRYENCPKQYYHINVKKDVKDEYGDSEAGAEGNRIHAALFRRLTRNDPFPLDLRYLEAVARPFAEAKGDRYGELKFALNRSFEQVDFFASDVYVRAIIDFLLINDTKATVIDWKTGKVRPDYTQLRMSAAVLSKVMPEIETFSLAYVWVKHRNVSPQTVTKAELLGIWNELLPRADRVEQAIKTTDFPAKPSGLCSYCPVVACPHYTSRD